MHPGSADFSGENAQTETAKMHRPEGPAPHLYARPLSRRATSIASST